LIVDVWDVHKQTYDITVMSFYDGARRGVGWRCSQQGGEQIWPLVGKGSGFLRGLGQCWQRDGLWLIALPQ
jgi:hypothetical protein